MYDFRVRDYYPLWLAFPGPFHYPYMNLLLLAERILLTTPHKVGFGLFPFRSPLLREWTKHFFKDAGCPPSLKKVLHCFLFLGLLECFTSPGSLSDKIGITAHYCNGVAPFGHRRIKGCSTPPRRISPSRRVLHRPLYLESSTICPSNHLVRKCTYEF